MSDQPDKHRREPDAELLTMRRLMVILDTLEQAHGEESVNRVLAWINGRYAPTPKQQEASHAG